MSYQNILLQIQSILNKCGDKVIITAIDEPVLSNQFMDNLSIPIEPVNVLKTNNCFSIQIPNPICQVNPDNGYFINRIRISKKMIRDYEIGAGYTDEELKSMISSKQGLFAYYDN